LHGATVKQKVDIVTFYVALRASHLFFRKRGLRRAPNRIASWTTTTTTAKLLAPVWLYGRFLLLVFIKMVLLFQTMIKVTWGVV